MSGCFLLLLLLLSQFIYPFFSVFRFRLILSYFSDAPSPFSLAFYTLDFVTYIFETLVTLLPCRKQWIRWPKNCSPEWLNLGPFHTNPDLKKYGFKNVQIRVDMAFRPCLQGGRGNPGARMVTLALAHFFFFSVSKTGSDYPSAFSHARGHLRVSRVLLDGPRETAHSLVNHS